MCFFKIQCIVDEQFVMAAKLPPLLKKSPNIKVCSLYFDARSLRHAGCVQPCEDEPCRGTEAAPAPQLLQMLFISFTCTSSFLQLVEAAQSGRSVFCSHVARRLVV